MHSLFGRAQNYTVCFHNPHLNVAFCEKVGIIALCLCTCVMPKSQKTLLEFLWKSPWEPLVTRSGSGLKWLQYSGISNDSRILREASGYTSAYVIFMFHFQHSEEWQRGIHKMFNLICACSVIIHLTLSLPVQNLNITNNLIFVVYFYY